METKPQMKRNYVLNSKRYRDRKAGKTGCADPRNAPKAKPDTLSIIACHTRRDRWFPGGKWATVQSIQAVVGAEPDS
jgi:hypothetical protein